MRINVFLTIILVANILLGCSSKIEVRNCDPTSIEPGDTIDGIPFRVRQRFRVQLYQKVEERSGAKYKKVYEEIQTLADPNRLYILNFKSGFFSDATAGFNLNLDGTITKVNLKSDFKGDEILTELGTQVTAVTGALATKKTAEQGEKAAAATALDKEEDLVLAAIQAKNAAELAEAELSALSPNATAVEKLSAEQKVQVTKMEANYAARRAGLPTPYP